MLWTVSQASVTDFTTYLPVKAPVKLTNLTICPWWKSSISLLHEKVLGSVLRDLYRNKISRQKRVQLERLGGWTCSRPCSPIWDKWNGSSGQTPCPCPTCPTKISRPPSPGSTCPTKIWRPPSPCPTCPTTPTCPNLSHLVVPLVLYQLSFLRFFLGFSASFHFSKTFLNEKFSSKYSCWRGYKWQPNFHKKTGDNHDHTIEHMGIFCSEFNSSVLWLQHTKNF